MSASPQQIREARESAGLSASMAATMVGVTTVTWQRWEGQTSMRPQIPAAAWELFLLKTDKHPTHELKERS